MKHIFTKTKQGPANISCLTAYLLNRKTKGDVWFGHILKGTKRGNKSLISFQ